MNLQKAKILLIEDDLVTVRMYRNAFSLANLKLITITEFEHALKRIKTEKPNLVLLDIKLNKHNGFEILKAMKKDAQLKNIPVFLLTNVREKGNREKGFALGAEQFIMKAKLLPDEIVDIVKKRLKEIK